MIVFPETVALSKAMSIKMPVDNALWEESTEPIKAGDARGQIVIAAPTVLPSRLRVASMKICPLDHGEAWVGGGATVRLAVSESPA